jgi:ABC-type glycerol-3-phosphate transport system permease component
MIGKRRAVTVRQGQQLPARCRVSDRRDDRNHNPRLRLPVALRQSGDLAGRGRRHDPERAASFDLLAVYAILYLVFLYGPSAAAARVLFHDAIFAAFPLKGFTLQWYGQMLSNGPLKAALYSSLKVGAAAAAVSTVLGVFAAKAVTRYRLPFRAPILA